MQEYLSQNKEWKLFVENELKQLNDLDQRNLGGQLLKNQHLDFSIENREIFSSENQEKQQNEQVQKPLNSQKEQKNQDRYADTDEANVEEFKFDNNFEGNEDMIDQNFYYTQEMETVDRNYDQADFVNIGDDNFTVNKIQAWQTSIPVFKSDQEHINLYQDDRELRDYLSNQYWSVPVQNISNLDSELS